MQRVETHLIFDDYPSRKSVISEQFDAYEETIQAQHTELIECQNMMKQTITELKSASNQNILLKRQLYDLYQLLQRSEQHIDDPSLKECVITIDENLQQLNEQNTLMSGIKDANTQYKTNLLNYIDKLEQEHQKLLIKSQERIPNGLIKKINDLNDILDAKDKGFNEFAVDEACENKPVKIKSVKKKRNIQIQPGETAAKCDNNPKAKHPLKKRVLKKKTNKVVDPIEEAQIQEKTNGIKENDLEYVEEIDKTKKHEENQESDIEVSAEHGKKTKRKSKKIIPEEIEKEESDHPPSDLSSLNNALENEENPNNSFVISPTIQMRPPSLATFEFSESDSLESKKLTEKQQIKKNNLTKPDKQRRKKKQN